jgi:ABC-type uncharacterized transport system involved in gliding motility auxiliary subunit
MKCLSFAIVLVFAVVLVACQTAEAQRVPPVVVVPTDELSRDPSAGEEPGPLTVALALTRPSPRAQEGGQVEQRVLVVGDGDFLSNAHLAQGGNRDLGLRLVRWASGQQGLDAPPERWAGDREVQLDDLRRLLVGGLSLVVLPLVFLSFGLVLRWYRWRG